MNVTVNFSPIPYEVSNLVEMIEISCAMFADNTAVQRMDKGGEIENICYSQLNKDIKLAANALTFKGFNNRRILIIAEKSYEWIVSFFAILSVNGTAVPICKEYIKQIINEEINNFTFDAIICDEEAQNKWMVFSNKNIENTITINSCEEPFWQLFDMIETLPCIEPRIETPEAVILFTSGTTGNIKGVRLSHWNLISDVKACQMLMGRNESDTMLSFLPIYHAFELTTAILTPLYVGATIGIPRGLKYAMSDIMAFAPTIMLIVPTIAQTFLKQIWRELHSSGYSKLVKISINIAHLVPILKRSIQKIIYNKVIKAFGGNLKVLVCGGSALSKRDELALTDLGFCVLCGYGITECSPVISCNLENNKKVGSVGISTPFSKLKVVDDELWVRGDIVSLGYLDNKQTKESYIDGWFKTGDLGIIDDEGFIYLNGRKNDLLVLDNGENIPPLPLEEALMDIPEVSDILICLTELNNMNLLTAIVYTNCLSKCTSNQILLRSSINKRIDELKFPSFMRIQRVIVSTSPFPITMTGKTNRKEVVSSLTAN